VKKNMSEDRKLMCGAASFYRYQAAARAILGQAYSQPQRHPRYSFKYHGTADVCSLNWDEDMTRPITQFQPFRWKAFQCLIVTGENDNEQRKCGSVWPVNPKTDLMSSFCDRSTGNRGTCAGRLIQNWLPPFFSLG
jgi:hypothetical protein